MSFNLSNEFFFLFFLFSIIFSYSIVRISKKIFKGQLLDKDFLKPQAFHKKAVARAGGLIFFFLYLIFIFLYFKIYSYFLMDYFILGFSLFVIGFLDDLKVKINPNYRLLLMLIILAFSINILSVEINRSGLTLLNSWLDNNIFQLCFVLLCLLFIINGSNLIDGYNGLLIIHFLIITSVYYLINISNQNISFSNILFIQMIIAIVILFFNFPKAKIFLGDSGSYLLGVLISINSIKTVEMNINIEPFFFAAILFYLFFEVFFSFVRKCLNRKSPLKPDDMHFHMIIFRILKKKYNLKKSNYLTSIIINLIYLTLISPLYYLKDSVFCRYYFILLILLYLLSYFKLLSIRLKKYENI